MQEIQQVVAAIFIAGGVFFFTVGTIGLIRMPDVFCRLHATTKSDTMGATLSLLGVVIYFGFSLISLKALIILIFIFLTCPTASHIIAKAAYNQKPGIEPNPKEYNFPHRSFKKELDNQDADNKTDNKTDNTADTTDST